MSETPDPGQGQSGQQPGQQPPPNPYGAPASNPYGQSYGQVPYGTQGYSNPVSGPYGQGQYAQPENHPQAVTALVLGILSLVMCGLFTGIPAMIIGRKATREIRGSGGRYSGDGMATAGFVTGLISTLITGLAFVFVVLVFIFGGVLTSVFDSTCNSVDSNGQLRSCQ